MTWIIALLAWAQADPVVEEETVFVIVAHTELPAGVPIVKDDLFQVAVPTRFVSEGMFHLPEHVVGRYPRERILPTEFIRTERLIGGIGGRLSDQVPVGFRIAALPVPKPVATELLDGGVVDLFSKDEEGTCALGIATPVFKAHIEGEEAWLIVSLTPEQLLVSARSAPLVGIRNENDDRKTSPLPPCKPTRKTGN